MLPASERNTGFGVSAFASSVWRGRCASFPRHVRHDVGVAAVAGAGVQTTRRCGPQPPKRTPGPALRTTVPGTTWTALENANEATRSPAPPSDRRWGAASHPPARLADRRPLIRAFTVCGEGRAQRLDPARPGAKRTGSPASTPERRRVCALGCLAGFGIDVVQRSLVSLRLFRERLPEAQPSALAGQRIGVAVLLVLLLTAR